MPAFYDKPAVFNQGVLEDVNRLNQLPFYLVTNQVEQFPIWNEFDQLYGKINWITNEGNIMKGVTPQRSPVGRSFFFPVAITSVSNKDVYQVTESVEQAVVYKHQYESFTFNFLPSFTAFWETYIQFANKDIVEKIACANNQFIETQMWFNATNVFMCGTGVIQGCPTAMGNAAGTAANSKTANWLIAQVTGQGGNAGVTTNMSLRNIYNAVIALQNDFAAPTFMGVSNMPKDNEGVKGKYVLLLSSESWMNLTWDPDKDTLKSIMLDLLFDDFMGSLFGRLTCKCKKYPIRFATANIIDGASNVLWAAGTPIDPEIFDVTDQKWKPNPYYNSLTSSPYQIAWLLGDSYCKTIKVGPPPKEFASQSMDAEKFYKLRWNGETRITDQVLIYRPDGTIDLNKYGENLQIISQLVHGVLMGERRYAFPIIERRKRPSIAA